jgi:hypothetical protein
MLLVIATSVASLISLAGDVIQRIVTQGANIPTSASVAITFLLVLAMDTGSVYAAIMIRIGLQRRQSWSTMTMHVVVLIVVSVLEAGTYIYMLVLYEHPHDPASWALVVARGLAEPLLAIYLVMATPITITPEDIAHQVEVVTGIAVLRDIVTQSSDPSRSLADKIAMYHASAALNPEQKLRLSRMYKAATTRDTQIVDADPLLEIEAPVHNIEVYGQPDPEPPDPPAPRPGKRTRRRSRPVRTRKPIVDLVTRQERVETILSAHPDASVRTIAKELDIPASTVHPDIRIAKAKKVSKKKPAAPVRTDEEPHDAAM